MRISNKKLKMVRISLVIISVMLIAYRMDIYSSPFGGCEITGFFTMLPGCTSWPFFGLGMAIVFIAFTIRPNSTVYITIGLVLTVLIGVLGGFSGLTEGAFKEIFSDPSHLKSYWRFDGYPMIIGGFSGYLFIELIKKLIKDRL